MAGTAVTVDRLNLRSAPEIADNVIIVLDVGTQLSVLDNQGGWVHVTTADGKTGYVSADHVTLSGDSGTAPIQSGAPANPSLAPTTTGGKTLVAAPSGGGQLNIRSSPAVVNDPTNVVEKIAGGAVLIPLEDDATVASKVGTTQAQSLWIHVQTPSGTQGYAAAWFVQYASGDQSATLPSQSQPVPPPQDPVVQSVQPTTTTTTTTPADAPSVLPGDLQVYFDFIAEPAQVATTPPIAQGYYDFQALAGQIGLPAPFDMLPTQQTNESIRNSLIVNGFGPNSFAQQNWHSWYSNTDGMHNGLDHIVSAGTPLLAVADGVIVGTEQDWKFLGTNDKCIILWPFLPPSVTDSQGRRMLSNVLVAYAHLSDNSKVSRHQTVKAGDVIGLSGAPGGQIGTNDHLHLEVHLISGDNNLPDKPGRHLADYSGSQSFGAISPFNPILFFSERMIRMHLRVGKKGNGGMPSYPDGFDFFSVGQYQYSSGLVIWNHLGQAWPNGIYDMPTLVTRAKGYTPFQSYAIPF